MFSLNSIDQDIATEFEELSGMNIEKNYSIGAAFQSLESGEKKNFSISKKGSRLITPSQKASYERIEEFCKLLIQTQNFYYSCKEAHVSETRAKFYITFLNITAAERGLPLLWIPKVKPIKSKLNEKQVSYIKYLVSKYSACKIAKMYNVNQATIISIRNGMTWKNTTPAIPVKYIIQSVNQYSHANKVYVTPIRTIDLDHFCINENTFISLLEQLRWGDKVRCPFCGSYDLYNINCTHGKDKWKCANIRCYNKFNVKIGTIYQGSKLPMAKWAAAIYLYFKDRSVSSYTIARELEITQKSAYYILLKIKENPYSIYFTEHHLKQFINEAA